MQNDYIHKADDEICINEKVYDEDTNKYIDTSPNFSYNHNIQNHYMVEEHSEDKKPYYMNKIKYIKKNDEFFEEHMKMYESMLIYNRSIFVTIIYIIL